MAGKKTRIAYFDCSSGISGDMILGALVDLGVRLADLRKGLGTLGLEGYRIQSRTVKRGMICGTKVDVRTVASRKGSPSPSRSFTDIRKMIQGSGLSPRVRSHAVAIFKAIAEAEARVHRTTIEKIHFHEVGAVDSIVDVVGGVLGLELLQVDRVYASPVNVGEGVVECQHGTLPVPAPATLRLLEGMPCYSSGVRKELATPTGAGFLRHYAEGFSSLPAMEILGAGYGAGTHEIHPAPNLLRIILGQTVGKGAEDPVVVVETNIDDMNPEFYDHVMESLFDAGAVDVYFTPVIMKKSRPAVQISVIAPVSRKEALAETLLRETSTFGVRFYEAGRRTLKREFKSLKTPLGTLKVKVGSLNGQVFQVAPEYEDCKKIARQKKRPLKQVYEEALNWAERMLRKE